MSTVKDVDMSDDSASDGEEVYVDDRYTLQRVFHRQSRKFNVEESVYSFRIAPFPEGLSYPETVERLHHLFQGRYLKGGLILAFDNA